MGHPSVGVVRIEGGEECVHTRLYLRVLVSVVGEAGGELLGTGEGKQAGEEAVPEILKNMDF